MDPYQDTTLTNQFFILKNHVALHDCNRTIRLSCRGKSRMGRVDTLVHSVMVNFCASTPRIEAVVAITQEVEFSLLGTTFIINPVLNVFNTAKGKSECVFHG